MEKRMTARLDNYERLQKLKLARYYTRMNQE